MALPRQTLWSKRLIAAAGLLALLVVPLLSVMPVQAFKPYTHAYSADRALEDVVADGQVTIDGREYAVNPRVVTALQRFPDYYRGGTIGPDGFPDLTYGQSVIHPTDTGKWMRYIFDKAWEAQTDTATYPSDDERLQILAFAYGYLTHASGDMWAHTLVNNIAGGVFPGVGEILTSADKAAIAIRHIIVEGYIGDATSGFDGNADRTAVGGDISDDSTPGVSINAPNKFVYKTLIDPNAPTPSPGRGPIIDAFLSLRASLVTELGQANPQPLQDALDAYSSTVAKWEGVKEDCDFDEAADVVNCVPALIDIGVDAVISTFEAFMNLMTGAIELAADAVKDAYIAAWIDDIDAGLQNWNELGLAISRALFDPQSRRNAQNSICAVEGGENESDRAACEDGVGAIDVLFYEADPFINNYLLSMAGAPDVVGDIRAALQSIAGTFDFITLALDQLVNPIQEGIAAIQAAVKQLVLDMIEEATGVDIEQLNSFLTNPTYWLNVTSTTIDLPGLGQTTLQLFQQDDHEQIDGYLGLGPNHHTGEFVLGQVESTRLTDDAVFNETTFAAFGNSVTTAKLLLLDSTELNRAMGDSLVAQGLINNAASVVTYPATSGDGPSNVMFSPLSGSDPWLTSIDSDHSWRSNPLPIFCDIGSADCGTPGLNPLPRDAALSGGNGQFPIWESCLARPAFRDLFTDWENGAQNFPDLNDAPSTDASDPNPPVSTLTPTGNVFTSSGTTYVGNGHSFSLGATDAVFTASNVNVQYRYYKDGTTPGDWQPLANGGAFSIPSTSGDGVWRIDYRAEDPCATFVDESGTGVDPLPPATSTTTVVLDTTAPVITIVSPVPNTLFDSDDLSTIDYTVDDGALGSGVASSAVTLDGGAAADGQTLDMFQLDTGLHTIQATSVDNLGNGSEATWSFTMQATAASLISNIDRGYKEGSIASTLIYLRLRNYAVMASIPHTNGNHPLEWHRLQAMVSEFNANWKSTIDRDYGAKMTKWAKEIVNQRR